MKQIIETLNASCVTRTTHDMYESSGKTYGDFFYLYRPLIDIVVALGNDVVGFSLNCIICPFCYSCGLPDRGMFEELPLKINLV